MKIRSVFSKSCAVLVSIALVALMLPAVAFSSSSTEDGFKYRVSDNAATITGYSGSATAIDIPSSLGGYAVTSINYRAFYGCTSLASVSIPSSVTYIDDSAFYGCTSLASVSIPSSVTYIDDSAFYGCTSLASVSIPSSVTTLGDSAFSGCTSLASVSIPSSVTTLGSGAFEGCSSLASVSIPSSVVSIGNCAFYGCTSLSSVSIPSSVVSIGNCAFWSCTSLASVSIPSSVGSIGENVFSGCTSLVSVSIPSSVTSIGFGAFSGCTSLVSVSIPSSVTFIGERAFQICTSLVSVSIPSSVTSIGIGAFHHCTSLTSVSILSSVTSIPDSAFYDCSSLVSVSIPSSVTSIGEFAFGGSKISDVYYGGSEWQRGSISIGYGNSSLTSATWRYNWSMGGSGSATSGTSIRQIEGARITVYENSVSADKDDAKMVLSANVAVTQGNTSERTNSKGNATIALEDDGDVIFSKSGYCTRTVSAGRIKSAKKIHLQKTSDSGPVFSGVWVGDTDALYDEVQLDASSKNPTTLEADVDWGGSSAGGIKLVQEQRSESFDGNGKLSTVLSERFDVTDTIYVVATDTDGRSVKKPLQTSVLGENGEPLVTKGWELSAGKAFTLSLPDSAPSFLANSSISASLPIDFPITWSAQDGKVYAAVGVDLAGYSSKDSWASDGKNTTHNLAKKTTGFINDLKDTGLFDSAASSASKSWKKLRNLTTTYKNAIAHRQGSFGWNADFTVMGFLEGTYDSSGEITWTDTGIIVNPSVSASTSYPFAVGPVPMFVEAKVSADIKASGLFIINHEAKTFKPNIELSGEMSLSAGLGVGMSKVLSLSGGATGTLSPLWKMNFYNRADHTDYFKLDGAVSLYVKATLAFFEYEYDSGPLLSGTLVEYPDSTVSTKSLRSSASASELAAEKFKPADLSYLDAGSSFEANGGQGALNLMGLLGLSSSGDEDSAETTLKTNVYRSSSVQYADLGGCKRLAVWLDGEGSDVNGLQLYWSRYDGSSWSDPAPVSDDGTLDQTPSLVSAGDGKAYLAWQDATRTFDTSKDTLDFIAGDFDISAAVFDGEGFSAEQTLARSGLDKTPQVCAAGGKAYVAWVGNDGDWLGEEAADNIFTSELASDGTWSAPTEAQAKLGAVGSIATDCSDGSLHLAWAADTDADGTSDGVRCDGKEVAGDGASDPVYLGGKLYWYQDGTVQNGDGLAGSIAASDFQLLSVGGRTACVYSKADGLESSLVVSYLDPSTKTWQDPVELSAADSTSVGSFAALGISSGVEAVFARSAVTGTFGDDDPYGTCNLVLLSPSAEASLSMGDAVYDDRYYAVGNNLDVSVDVANSGTAAATGTYLQALDADGKVLATASPEGSLLPGETSSATLSIPVTTEDAQDVTIKLMSGGSEVASQTVTLKYDNVAVGEVTWGALESGGAVVSADVENLSTAESGSITASLRKGSADGDVVATRELGSIAAKSLAVASFDVGDVADGDVYCVTIEGDTSEHSSDDAGSVVVLKEDGGSSATLGDVTCDGAVDVRDCVALQRHLAGKATLTGDALEAADYNGDGAVGMKDLLALAKGLLAS